MTRPDFSTQHKNAGGTIRFVSALTEKALPNSELERHSTHYNEFEIYRFLEGELYFSFEGRRIKIRDDTMIIICNGTLHRPLISTPCRYRRKRILFNKGIFTGLNTADLELYNRLRKRKILILHKQAIEQSGIDRIFSDIEASLSRGTPYDDFCALIALFSLLIKAEQYSQPDEHMGTYVHNEKIARILRYIDDHLTDDLSYKVLSRVFYLSEKSLYKFFKNETGFALGNYIKERRIIKAQSVLNAGGSAKAAAEAAGFKDYSVFYRCFLKKVGVTPTDYIKESGQ